MSRGARAASAVTVGGGHANKQEKFTTPPPLIPSLQVCDFAAINCHRQVTSWNNSAAQKRERERERERETERETERERERQRERESQRENTETERERYRE